MYKLISLFFVVFVDFRYCRGTSSGDFFPLGTFSLRGDFLPQGFCIIFFIVYKLISFFFVVFVGFRYCRGTSSGDFFPLGTFSLRGVFPSGDFLPQGFCIIFFSVYKLISFFFVVFVGFRYCQGTSSGDFFPLGTFSLRGDFLPQGFCIIFFIVYKLISFFFVGFRRFSSASLLPGGRPLGTFSLWGLSPSGGTFSLRAFALFSLFQRLRLMPPTPRLAGDLGLGG